MPGLEERGNGESLLNGDKVSFWGDENIPELDSGYGSTTLCI